jgi:hypothetical protein
LASGTKCPTSLAGDTHVTVRLAAQERSPAPRRGIIPAAPTSVSSPGFLSVTCGPTGAATLKPRDLAWSR